ncbi:MAG: non-canonical purine NTP pyrophosphatase [Patescibacteria group bacterium]|jgi:non-canonical purine NTP pyrophosphatase (RdgB/HAM1 family)
MKIYVATTNEGKLKEIRAGLDSLNAELIPLGVETDEVEEALKKEGVRDMVAISQAKAREAQKFIKEKGLEAHPVIVDDAGIYFADRIDFPGIDSKSYIKQVGLEGAKAEIQEGSKAYFQSVVSLADGDSVESFVGRVNGTLSKNDTATETEKGFPFNHLFIPEGEARFLYQIPIEERKGFSHRMKALAELRDHLKERLEQERIKEQKMR